MSPVPRASLSSSFSRGSRWQNVLSSHDEPPVGEDMKPLTLKYHRQNLIHYCDTLLLASVRYKLVLLGWPHHQGKVQGLLSFLLTVLVPLGRTSPILWLTTSDPSVRPAPYGLICTDTLSSLVGGLSMSVLSLFYILRDICPFIPISAGVTRVMLGLVLVSLYSFRCVHFNPSHVISIIQNVYFYLFSFRPTLLFVVVVCLFFSLLHSHTIFLLINTSVTPSKM